MSFDKIISELEKYASDKITLSARAEAWNHEEFQKFIKTLVLNMKNKNIKAINGFKIPITQFIKMFGLRDEKYYIEKPSVFNSIRREFNKYNSERKTGMRIEKINDELKEYGVFIKTFRIYFKNITSNNPEIRKNGWAEIYIEIEFKQQKQTEKTEQKPQKQPQQNNKPKK